MKRKFIKKVGIPEEERNKFISMVCSNIQHLPETTRNDVVKNLKEVVKRKNKYKTLSLLSLVTRKIAKDPEFTEEFIHDPNTAVNSFKVSEDSKEIDFHEFIGDYLKNNLPNEEIERIIASLNQMKLSGYHIHQIYLIIHNLERSPQFRSEFIRNPDEAIGSLGIQPW